MIWKRLLFTKAYANFTMRKDSAKLFHFNQVKIQKSYRDEEKIENRHAQKAAQKWS